MSQKNKKEEQTPVEVIILPQLASSDGFVAFGLNDERKLTKISAAEAFTAAYFDGVPSYRGGNWAKEYMKRFVIYKQSEEGWRANQLIRGIMAAKGTPQVGLAKKPGIIGRYLTERDWKEKAQSQGLEVEK